MKKHIEGIGDPFRQLDEHPETSRFFYPVLSLRRVDVDGEALYVLADQGGFIANEQELDALFARLKQNAKRHRKAIDESNADTARQASDPEYRRSLREDGPTARQPRIVSGHVYLVECDGRHKIGKAKKVSNRVGHFDTIYPKPVTLVAHARFDDMDGMERHLHAKYADRRIHGEWFDLSPEQVDEVKAALS